MFLKEETTEFHKTTDEQLQGFSATFSWTLLVGTPSLMDMLMQ